VAVVRRTEQCVIVRPMRLLADSCPLHSAAKMAGIVP
jgi:hypothetical protein